MSISAKDRLQNWRRRKVEKGFKSLTIWIDSQTAEMMINLKRHFGLTLGGKWTKRRLVTKAIKELYKRTLGD